MLITIYFPEKNEKLDYTKCIIPENKLDFFIELGAFKTQEEAEKAKNTIEITMEDETQKRKPGRPKKIK